MDPGLGLIVNSIVPNEADVPKLPPKSTLQLPAGFLEKPHVRHALKYMEDDEQREKALRVAMVWKKKFAADKWKPVVASIEAASKEDHVRTSPHDDFEHPVERPRALTTASAPIVPQTTQQVTPARSKLTRLHTATASLPLRRTPAPITPRTFRWDVISSGPVTPLSPMPVGNAFSDDAFWRKTLSPTAPEASTPITAAEHQPGSPIVPLDPEARTFYDIVKNEVDDMSRKYCLARHNMRSSGENSFVLPNLIRPKDVLQAAQLALDGRKMKLKPVIVEDLPARLWNCALEEVALRRQLRIRDATDLLEQNDWMNNDELMSIPEIEHKDDYIPPAIHHAVSILDEQREALRMFRAERKSAELELPEKALEAAWAVRILEDAERLMASDTDGFSSSDDDEGYNYGNFLRSIRSEMSTSTSSGALAGMVEELSHTDLATLRSRANTQQTVSSTRSRDSRFPQRSSTSPIKEDRLPMRLGRTSNSFHRRTDLRISTEVIDEVPTGELSPVDRESRHRGPSFTDLNNWAEDLRKMEAMRAERQRSLALHRRPPADSNKHGFPIAHRSPTKRMSVDEINNRISPTRQLHSRFSSSSSSMSSNLLGPLPRPSLLQHSPTPSLFRSRSDSRPTILDHQYHQRKMSKGSISTHQHHTSKASMHDSLRRDQHLRSTSSVSFSIKGSSKEGENEWMSELKRMESEERDRQSSERRRASQTFDGEVQGGQGNDEIAQGLHDEVM